MQTNGNKQLTSKDYDCRPDVNNYVVEGPTLCSEISYDTRMVPASTSLLPRHHEE